MIDGALPSSRPPRSLEYAEDDHDKDDDQHHVNQIGPDGDDEGSQQPEDEQEEDDRLKCVAWHFGHLA